MEKGDSPATPATPGATYMGTPIFDPDEVDARPDVQPAQSDSVVPPSQEVSGQDQIDTGMEQMEISEDLSNRLLYRMDHAKRGQFIIVNNKKFNPSTRMGERTGTDADAAGLFAKFKGLGFTCKIYHNLTAYEMLKLMLEVSKADHSDSDCLGVAVLSHGDDGIVYGIDQVVKIDTLVAPFKGDKCPSLLGKPKIFIIQACRGANLDHGAQHDAQAEGQAQVYKIPTEADIVYAYSTVSGYFSWRNSSKGSWFIQALCNKLEKYGQTWDFMKILTYVNHQVAYEFESNASAAHMNKKKQVPSVVSMLTKELVFLPKRQ